MVFVEPRSAGEEVVGEDKVANSTVPVKHGVKAEPDGDEEIEPERHQYCRFGRMTSQPNFEGCTKGQ